MFSKILLLLFSLSFNSFAGSCCGGGGGTTKIMLGDTDKVFRASFFDRTILADVKDRNSLSLRREDEIESLRSLNLSTSIRFNDSWQYGVIMKVMSKAKMIGSSRESYQGLGDTEINLAYEFMPEISRSSILSQGFIYSKIQIPTGSSLYTTQRRDSLDTFGTGHYLLSLGTIFTKRNKFGMANVTLGLSYRPSRSFDSSIFSNGTIITNDSLNYDIALNHSFDLSQLISFDLGVSRTYISNLSTSAFSLNESSAALNSLSLGVSYNTEFYTYLVSYIDDFLIGSSYNSILGRSVELSIIKKVNL